MLEENLSIFSQSQEHRTVYCKNLLAPNTSQALVKVYKTYIKGFDEEMEGGIPQGHVVLISGPPGTMKSSITFNMLYKNALEQGTRGVYVTLEQGKSSIEFQMSRM